MKYKGIELEEFTSDRPVVFDPPKKMLVWCNGDLRPDELDVHAYIPARAYPVVLNGDCLSHCAEIPEEPKPRRATNLELVKWLAQGNGLCRCGNSEYARPWCGSVSIDWLGDECLETYSVRKWDDEEWHEPTADYMGLEA